MKLQNFKILFFVFLINEANALVRALNIAATGMKAQEAHVNTISNNIANANTTAFKKANTEFSDLAYQTIREPGARSSNNTMYNVGIQLGNGSKVTAVTRNFSTGTPKITNNAFDFMIQGDGFFGIIQPNNLIQYTKNGSFGVDSEGNIVDKKGNKLFPGFVVPPASVKLNVSSDGKIEAFLRNQVAPVQVGQIPVFNFVNPDGLNKKGDHLYSFTQASGPPIQQIPGQDNAGTILQGALESSNVNIMTEMTDLIRAQRTYEMNSKVMGVADAMLQTVNNIR